MPCKVLCCCLWRFQWLPTCLHNLGFVFNAPFGRACVVDLLKREGRCRKGALQEESVVPAARVAHMRLLRSHKL